MKIPLVAQAPRWALMFCLLLPLHGAAEQFVELAAEVDFEDWDYRLFKDRINNDPGQSHLMLPSIFTTNSTLRCVVGSNTWMMEFDSENAKTTYWFTGTNIIEHTLITRAIPGRPRVGERLVQTHPSRDGNPGR